MFTPRSAYPPSSPFINIEQLIRVGIDMNLSSDFRDSHLTSQSLQIDFDHYLLQQEDCGT